MNNFVNVLNSEATERVYKNAIKMYMEFYNMDIKNCDSLLEIDKDRTFEMIQDFIVYQRKPLKKSLQRINTLFSAIKLFYLINRYQGVDWFVLARFKGKETKKNVDDRSYTREEIQLLLQHATLRMKVIILTLLSSGIRVGGLADLKIKDITYIEDRKLYRITVYSDSPTLQYYTFCTPECAHFINLYLDYRNKIGERITPESPFIRTEFDSDIDITIPAKSIQAVVRLLLVKTGLRTTKEIRSRSNIMVCHGFRKFFNTICIESEMNLISKELLMGHKKNLGLEKNYYRPTSDKLLNEYLKVVNELTINDEHRLKVENQNLKEKLIMNKNEVQELKQALQVIAKHVNFPIEEFNKKFNLI